VKSQYRLACYAIVLIVVLRIGIGCHFFYEGIKKFDPADGFSSAGFLGFAKGPTADLYYWMLPDLDGIQRLVIETVQGANDREHKTFIVYENAWKEYFKKYLMTYSPLVNNEADAERIIDMDALQFVEWIKANVPDMVAENIADMNAVQLTAWADRNVLSINTPEDISSMNAAQLADWARQNFRLTVAEEIIGKNAEQLADWAQQNVPLTDTSKRDAVLEARMLVSARTIFNRYLNALRTEAADSAQDIEAFLKSRERFLETRRTIRNNTSFEQERRWHAMMGYRREAAIWTWTLTEMGNGLQSDLGRLVTPELSGRRGEIVTAPERELIPPNPFVSVSIPVPTIEITIPPNNAYLQSLELSVKSRMDVMDLGVMFGLSAIGLCLMLGFCTRLACLGGAAFLVNVVLTTFPVPGVYPEIPSIVGNFMFVSKDVVELLALLVLAAIPSGRWGGLDYFLWNYGGKQIVGLFCPACAKENT
jgi:uncharacterized membrane protein YphA (DoxX/SURF4 family)